MSNLLISTFIKLNFQGRPRKWTRLSLNLKVLKAKTIENKGPRNAVRGVQLQRPVLQVHTIDPTQHATVSLLFTSECIHMLVLTLLTSVVCCFLPTDQRMRQAF